MRPRLDPSKFPREAAMWHGFSSVNNLRVLYALDNRELCVNELVEILGMSQPLVSQHLHKLVFSHLVTPRRSRHNIYYSISDPKLVLLLRAALEMY
ncbi:ArsR/SmtB family transcription factor [Propionivibrio dicarboxylicus]|uniref:ArsR/SmtB family transcription factor n=1 Tax=Propionivibrio dicarboxylicus TaxID=83767 RepID=UPI000B83AF8D